MPLTVSLAVWIKVDRHIIHYTKKNLLIFGAGLHFLLLYKINFMNNGS